MLDKRQQAELQRKEAERKEKIRNAQIEKDLQHLMNIPQFKRYMSTILERGCLFQSVMTGNSMTYHNSGKQDFAREIFAGIANVNREFALSLLIPQEFGDSDD